jgi:hypothetical protein
VKLPLPKGLERRLAPLIERGNTFLKEWEWTWAKAVVFGVGFWLFLIVSTSGIPSWWLYFATNTLDWVAKPENTSSFWLEKLRDFIGVNLAMGPGVTVIIIGYLLQKQRKKLRGETGQTRPTGGYR